MLGRIVLSSTVALSFHIALVFLRVSAVLFQGANSHTEKHTRGQKMRPKIASRTSSVFASSSRQGAVVERACMQAKFGCSESANEQSSRAQGGSEPGRRGASRVMTADQVHAAAVVGECANSGQRGRLAYTCGPHGVPQEYARCGDTERITGTHQ